MFAGLVSWLKAHYSYTRAISNGNGPRTFEPCISDKVRGFRTLIWVELTSHGSYTWAIDDEPCNFAAIPKSEWEPLSSMEPQRI